ncbi:MAG TPA: hypothetical protein DCE41_30050 [Cytophagales bacterium]|nr:hypothetical protein [Cytophagales bacterium]HAA17454.1 hypothetical protein [Cytophagales bacterium]HAP64898.1 hypothetical protein [Cytophagales bacterium]
MPPWLKKDSYQVRQWTTETGLPFNGVQGGVHSQEGYIWIWGYEGLARFDGYQFLVMDEEIHPLLQNEGMLSAYEDSRGRLWIFKQKGGVVIKDRSHFYRPPFDSVFHTVNFYRIIEDQKGGFFLLNELGMFYYDDKGLRKLPGFTENSLLNANLIIDHQNNLWISVPEGGIYQYDGQQIHKVQLPGDESPLRTFNLFLVPDGAVGLLLNESIVYFNADRTLRNEEPLSLNIPYLGSVQYHESLGLLALDLDGLQRKTETGWQTVVSADEISLKLGQTIFTDQKGDVWICTTGSGLVQVSDVPFINYEMPQTSRIFSLLPEENQLLISSALGLFRLTNHSPELLPETQTLAIKNILRDQEDALWLATYSGVFQWDEQRNQLINTPLSTTKSREVIEDSQGRIWVGLSGGVQVNEKGNWSTPTQLELLREEMTLSMYEDSQKGIWINTSEEGSFRWDGQSLRQFSKSDGLPSNVIFRAVEDSAQNMWFATTKGLALYQGDSIVTLSEAQGLPESTVFQMLFDSQNRMWGIGLNQVWCVPLAGLYDVVNGDLDRIPFAGILDDADGLLEGGASGVATARIDKHGYLYIPAVRGVSIINTQEPFRDDQPRLLLDHTVHNGQTQFSDSLVLAPATNRLQIAFTAIDFHNGAQLELRYRLVGFDEDWQQANASRVAEYTSLPPGHFTFQAQLRRKDGTWTPAQDLLWIHQRPAFYQTVVFIGLAFASVILGTLGMLRWRFRVLQARNVRLEDMVAERTQTIEDQKRDLEQKSKAVESSIRYAQRIQDARLPQRESLTRHFAEHFVYYVPKDIVAGDFFWLRKQGEDLLFAVADCTGHGVPGAMMSLVASNLLNETIEKQGVQSTGSLLDSTRQGMLQALKSSSDVQDGMDIALIHLRNRRLAYSGAFNPLWILRRSNGDSSTVPENFTGNATLIDEHLLLELPADRQPIGPFANPVPFGTQEMDLLPGDTLYMFTDGLTDQFGGPHGKKFSRNRLRQLLLSIQDLSLAQQRDRIASELLNWQGAEEQVDDICLVGLRV